MSPTKRHTALIVEDEKLAATRLAELITASNSDFEIIGSPGSVKDAIIWLTKNPGPDLIFMDIDLGDGLCFEIFEIVDVKSPIIFTTAFDQYAIKAFKVNSVDYLLKPIDTGELNDAIQKFLNQSFDVSRQRPSIDRTAELLAGPYKERFIVKIGEHLNVIPVNRISIIYSREKATFAQTDELRNFPLDHSLDRLEEILDPKYFFRINRQQIINFPFVKDIISYSNSRLKVIIKGSVEGVISRDRVGEFKKWLDR